VDAIALLQDMRKPQAGDDAIANYLKQTFILSFDRAFIYAIRDNQTGNILFMGSLIKPNSPQAEELTCINFCIKP